MTPADAFLAAIRAQPGDDTVRLAFADWLEEFGGEAERAAFVRYDVRYPHAGFSELVSSNPFPLLGIPEPAEGVIIGPPSGDLFLDDANRRTWMWGEAEEIGCVVHDLVRKLDYRVDRGFIQLVRCPLAAWLAHGPDVVARHPVERVEISDREPVVATARDGGGYHWLRGGENARHAAGIPEGIMACGLWDERGRPRQFASRSLALNGLSAGCLAWAKTPVKVATV